MSRRVVMVCLACGSSAVAAPPTFEILPSTVAGSGSYRVLARGVSGDGQVVAGSTSFFDVEKPYVWRRVDGAWERADLPAEGPQGQGRPVSLSRTGDTIAGMTNRYMPGAVAYGTPAVWTGVLSGMPVLTSPLDNIPAQVRRGVLTGISEDGAFMAGFAKPLFPTTGPGEIWSHGPSGAGQMSPAGSPTSFASALLCGNVMSADGSIVVGSMQTEPNRTVAFRWTAASGFVELATPATGFRNSRAETITRDGAVIGGHLTTEPSAYNTNGRPVVWTSAGRADLPVVVSLGLEGRVLALSADGHVAGGVVYSGLLGLDGTGVAFSGTNAALWMAGPSGWQATGLASYLAAQGVSLQGVTPNWLTGLSDDGRVMVGFGTRATVSDVVSFVVTLPEACAADVNGDGVIDFADYLEFLNLYEAQSPRADFTGDGTVDFADYLEFLNHYDAGC